MTTRTTSPAPSSQTGAGPPRLLVMSLRAADEEVPVVVGQVDVSRQLAWLHSTSPPAPTSAARAAS